MTQDHMTHVPMSELLDLHATIGAQAFHLATLIEAVERLDPDRSAEEWFCRLRAHHARRALDASVSELADQLQRMGTTTPATTVRVLIDGAVVDVCSVERAAEDIERESNADRNEVAHDLRIGITFTIEDAGHATAWVPVSPAEAIDTTAIEVNR